jgi:MFS family permease
MMNPLHHEFGWPHGVVGLAMSVNMTLFGVTASLAVALMDRFGVRPVLSAALALIATGSAVSVTMTASWQLVLLWGCWSASAPAPFRWDLRSSAERWQPSPGRRR